MSKKKKNNRDTNPDFRHRSGIPAPSVEEIEQRLMAVLTPGAFAPLRMAEERTKLRERILTLPVMTAIVVSLVWRQIPSLSEVLRVLAREGLLWVRALKVSKQALSERLEKLPATLFAQVFEEVISCMRKSRGNKTSLLPTQGSWERVHSYFSAIWIADGSTLEALRRRVDRFGDKARVLGGKMMVIVGAFTHVPVSAFYTKDAHANDKIFVKHLLLLERLPIGGLMVFDLGFFSFPFFDDFTEQEKYFVTCLREKTAYRVVAVLSEGSLYRDEIIEMGKYRSNPCRHRVRMVSVLWNGRWYRYLTNVMDPQILSAREVCELYRRRWRVEDAFLVTKRLLGLSYLWVGGNNGVEIQIYATWIFYAILNDVSQQVAQALWQPLERISVEMVFRGFYHFSRAYERGESKDIVAFLAEHSKLLGIVKVERKRHKQIKLQQQEIWGDTLN